MATLTFRRDTFREIYARRRSSKNPVGPDEALELLYSFSVIGYRSSLGTGGSGWYFQYLEPQAGYDNASSILKVHLGLKEYAKLREERATV